MKKNSRFAGFYMGLIFFLMYLPIAVVIVFSFNESKLPVKFTGFSLKWYQELFYDRAMLEALVNSLILGVLSCLVSAVIGTLGAVGLSRIHWKSKGALPNNFQIHPKPDVFPKLLQSGFCMNYERI